MNPAFWNQRYAESEPVYGIEPNVFLASQLAKFPPKGSVLCLGEGEGRNATWLASKGMRVTALDYAETAMQRTRALAEARGVDIETVVADLSTYAMPTGAYEGVVSVFLHLPQPLRTSVHRSAIEALRPGGVFVAEYFSKEQLAFGSGGPANPAMLYSVEELRADFGCPGAHIERIEKVETDLQEGRYHCGRASTIRLVVRRVS